MKQQETTKQRILESAKQLFAQQGYDKTSIRSLAIEAQVSHGLIRHHFGNKEQVWYAVADLIIAEVMNERIELNDYFQHNFRANDATYLMISKMLDNLVDNPLIMKLVIQFSLGQQLHFDYFFNQVLLINKDLRVLIEQCSEENYLKSMNAAEIINMLYGMVSMPAAQPKLFIANYEQEIDHKVAIKHYLQSVKSLFANLLQVNEQAIIAKVEQLKA